MQRDSFIFYRSFYDAIIGLPKDIQLEVLTAVIEYALLGRLPENLKPVAKGMFTLIKPNIDVNTARFENGKKGGRRSSSVKRPDAPEPYSLTFNQEVEHMKADEQWRDTICSDFRITPEEYDHRLSRFLDQCKSDIKRKGKNRHDSIDDCHSHLRYWMTKAYPNTSTSVSATIDDTIPFPDVTTDFGGLDYDEQYNQ